MARINIKPLSINRAYRGKRFQSSELKQYHRDLFYLLPKIDIPKGKLKLEIEFGFSSKGSDADNCVKPFQDVLQDTYRFNDNMIYELHVYKVDVKKGMEYIDFKLSPLST